MARIRLLLLVLFGFFPAIAFSQSFGQPSSDHEAWLEQMRLGGYVIVLRHGATVPDKTTMDPMSNPAASTKPGTGERQLSEAGRAQARAVGETMRKLRIPVSVVLTSPLQRAVDTGTLLGFGEVTRMGELAEAGPALSPEENKRRADALRQLAAKRPPADNNLVIVTHKPNLVEAFGKDWSDIREGEASVFEPDLTGSYKLVMRIRAEEWGALLQATH